MGCIATRNDEKSASLLRVFDESERRILHYVSRKEKLGNKSWPDQKIRKPPISVGMDNPPLHFEEELKRRILHYVSQ